MAEKKIPTRQLLLETAGELFAEHGFAATSVNYDIKELNEHSQVVLKRGY